MKHTSSFSADDQQHPDENSASGARRQHGLFRRMNGSVKLSSSPEARLYHERQKLQLCALHSLNNLFQSNLFTKRTLDSIVHEYDKSWYCNEYSTLFTGNYDLTIVLEALKRHGYTVRAIDCSELFEKFDFNICFGILLNIPIERPMINRWPILRSLSSSGRHWLTIKNVDGQTFWNLDSKLREPKLIGNREKLIEHLNEFDRTKTYMYIVIQEAMSETFAQ